MSCVPNQTSDDFGLSNLIGKTQIAILRLPFGAAG